VLSSASYCTGIPVRDSQPHTECCKTRNTVRLCVTSLIRWQLGMTILDESKCTPLTSRRRQLWSAKLCILSMIPCFRREVDENRTLQGYYAASGGNSLRRFGTHYQSHLQVALENGTGFSETPGRYSWNWDRHVVPKRRQGTTTIRYVRAQKSAILCRLYLFTMIIRPVFREANNGLRFGRVPRE